MPAQFRRKVIEGEKYPELPIISQSQVNLSVKG